MKISGPASLSKSKKAAPLPVVSIMYFLAFPPPASVVYAQTRLGGDIDKIHGGRPGGIPVGCCPSSRVLRRLVRALAAKDRLREPQALFLLGLLSTFFHRRLAAIDAAPEHRSRAQSRHFISSTRYLSPKFVLDKHTPQAR